MKTLKALGAAALIAAISAGAMAANNNTYTVSVINHDSAANLDIFGVRDTKSYFFSHGVTGSVKTAGPLFTEKKLEVAAGQPASGTFTLPSESELGVYLNLKTVPTGSLTSWGYGCRIHLVVNADGTTTFDKHATGFGWASGKMCKYVTVQNDGTQFTINVTPPVDAKRA